MKCFKAVRVVVIFLAGFFVFGALLSLSYGGSSKQVYGVSFSTKQARSLGIDWREMYDAILDDLGVEYLRLNAYWDEIEPGNNEYDFSTLDYQMSRAVEEKAKVVLAIGRKLPRWPECHEPEWLENKSKVERRLELLEMVEAVARRYSGNRSLFMWQLENEPFFDFGVCEETSSSLLNEEEEVLRRFGGGRPIVITDSGELSLWFKAARYGDVFGTTMYRSVYSHSKGRRVNYDYKFPAWLYRVKANLVRILEGKRVIITELQGEPWLDRPFSEASREERLDDFPPQRLKSIKDFSQRTRLGQAYWWGVEYWYWEKEQGDSRYWELARSFFN